MDQEVDTRRAYRDRLRALVQATLARRGPWLHFPDPLHDLYDADQKASRPRELWRYLIIGLAAFAAGVLALNLFVVSHPSWRYVALQLGLVPAPALLLAYLGFDSRRHAVVREAAAAAVSSCFTLATVLAVCNSPPGTALPNFFLVTLPLIFTLYFVRPRFAAAVAFSLVSAAGLIAGLYHNNNIAPDLRAYPLGFLITAAVPALFGVHELERGSRRNFLHGILQKLQIEELASENFLLGRLSATDSLTGAANRRRLDLALAEICAVPSDGDFLLLVDIDHFKEFNDRHGHLAGDAALREVVGAMQLQLRRSDLLARFGGEEFAILLIDTPAEQAIATAERLRQAVQAHHFTVDGKLVHVTVSVGVGQGGPGYDARLLVSRADSALYEAKRGGRNCVRVDIDADVAA